MTTPVEVADHVAPATKRQYPVETVELCLWELAAHGGNATRAQQSLEEAGVRGPEGQVIPRSTLSDWKKKTYRNRYHQIQHERVRELDELHAQAASQLATEMEQAELRAIRQTMAGLSMATGLEASQILRNVSQAKGVNLTGMQAIRGGRVVEGAARSLAEIAAELKRVAPGIVQVTDGAPVVDAELVEEFSGDASDDAAGRGSDGESLELTE